MCDTWVAMRDATLSGQVLFGKNSDRPIFDCQPLVFHARQTWVPGSTLQLEYVELPQVEVTFATLGSSPYWCWGYEEGINEHGVVIGNEAIPTRTFRDLADQFRQGGSAELGLLGMDLIRLALERSRSARQAVEMMGALIEQYGQFGSGVPTRPHDAGGYDGSFIIADPGEAWIVEAVSRRWVARCVDQGTASISNEPSTRFAWDLGSRDVIDYAVGKGWSADPESHFDFARAYIDDRVPRQVSHLRVMRSRQLLAERQGEITLHWMKRIARDHYEDTFLQGPYFDAADPDFHSLCMHSSAANFTWGNTASSCVAVLPRFPQELPVFWWTPGPPCNGCYAPFFVHGSKLPDVVSNAGTFGKRVVGADAATEDTFSPNSYWWLFRELVDRVKGHPITSLPGYYPIRNRRVRERFDPLEQEFEVELPDVLRLARAARDADSTSLILDEFTERCVQRVMAVLRELLSEFSAGSSGGRPS
jgi:secernin